MEQENKKSGFINLEKFPLIRKKLIRFPVFLIIPIGYVIAGRFTGLWHPLWMFFFLIPIHFQLIFAFSAKSVKSFVLRLPIVFIVVPVFLICGFFFNLWSYAWVIFLLLPLYYWYAAIGFKKD